MTITEEITHDPDAAIVYEEVGPNGPRFVYRASAAFTACPNALLLARRGVTPSPPPPALQKRFDMGKTMEPIILEQLREKYGFKVYGQQSTVEMDLPGGDIIRGHVDGLTTEDGIDITHVCGQSVEELEGQPSPGYDILVIDAKALAPSGMKQYREKGLKSFPGYYWQQSFYCQVPGYSGVVMAIYDKVDGEMIVDFWPADRLVPLAQLKVAAMKMVAGKSKKPFEVDCTKMYPCPYFREHPVTEAKKVKGKIVADVDQVTELAEEYADAQQRESQANKDKTEAATKIATLFGKEEGVAPGVGLKLELYHATYSMTHWDRLARDLGMTEEKCKEKYTDIATSSKLTPRVSRAK
jgi:hypothetical protein